MAARLLVIALGDLARDVRDVWVVEEHGGSPATGISPPSRRAAPGVARLEALANDPTDLHSWLYLVVWGTPSLPAEAADLLRDGLAKLDIGQFVDAQGVLVFRAVAEVASRLAGEEACSGLLEKMLAYADWQSHQDAAAGRSSDPWFSALLEAAATASRSYEPGPGIERFCQFSTGFMAKALQSAGVRVHARNSQDMPTREFFFRRNPGKIKSASANPHNQPCHFRVGDTFPILEIHAGVQHRGVSEDLHEIDICIVPQEEVVPTRSLPKGGAYVGARCLALELKEYGDDTFIDKNIPRALLGVMADLDPALVAARAAQRPGARFSMLSHYGPAPHYALLTTAKIRPPSKTFLTAHGVQWAEGLNCRDESDAIDQLAQRVAELMRRR